MGRDRRNSATSPGNRDRTLECAVCGKTFSRGHLDLTRHMNAVTLQHLFAKVESKDFPFGCSHCGIYFTNQDHLNYHNLYTTCGKSEGTKRIRCFTEDLSEEGLSSTTNSAEKINEPPNFLQLNLMTNSDLENTLETSSEKLQNTKELQQQLVLDQGVNTNEFESPMHLDLQGKSNLDSKGNILDLALEEKQLINESSFNADAATFSMEVAKPDSSPSEDPLSQNKHDGKTMECMVCGKLFPRGPIDLQRHATATTLKHLVSRKRSLNFNHECSRCGLYFTSEEHLQMHSTSSTCNPSIVWPHYADSMSGLRAIPRSQLESVPPPPPLTSPRTPNTPGALRKSFGTPSPYPLKRKDSFSNNRNSDFVYTPLSGASRATRANSYVESDSKVDSAGGSLRKKRKQIMTIDYESIKQKRTKFILPEDRKAYYAIISLLIDSSLVDPAIAITEENYEQFILPEHLELVEKLKNVLQYTV